MKQASHATQLPDQKAACYLCPHHCVIAPGKHGRCLTRGNNGGTLYAFNYCRPASMGLDPIEKKPLYHFYPGSAIFSAGPYGCNFMCSFCQNHEISQNARDARELSLDEMVSLVAARGSIGIAYTYSEPTIWFETIMDLGLLVRERGLKNVMVTNGYVETAPLSDLLSVVDAMNIDIKSINPAFYRKHCKGTLAEVLRTCETAKKAGCHVEITNLLIPGENDDPGEMRQLAQFVAGTLGKETPLHISRYFPKFTMSLPPTPSSSLSLALRIAGEFLDYVYIGNDVSGTSTNTCCPNCGTLLISRSGYQTTVHPELSAGHLNHSVCLKCGHSPSIML